MKNMPFNGQHIDNRCRLKYACDFSFYKQILMSDNTVDLSTSDKDIKGNFQWILQEKTKVFEDVHNSLIIVSKALILFYFGCIDTITE